MGRYRPPRTPAPKYITPEGYRRLTNELDYLWRQQRPRVTQAVAEAAAQGDRSENAEYIYGKKQLREIDSRIRFLRKRIEGMTIVEGAPSDPSRIYFGAWVELEDDEGKCYRYRIVGPDEFDQQPDYISVDAPLARAMLKKQVDDEIVVRLPSGGVRRYYVTALTYSAPDAGGE